MRSDSGFAPANGRPLLSSAAAVMGLAAANPYIVAFAISGAIPD
jgi:hypothetical protein